MSARSIKRAHARRSMARRAAVGTAAALGAGAIAASGAQAADFPVSNTNDAGAGSLRAAIIAANGAAGADTISFTAAATGRIELVSGLDQITEAVSVNGPGADKLTIDGNESDPVFEVDVPGTGVPVSISGLKIVNGDSKYGGGIVNYGSDLTVADAIISGNEAEEKGGGIYSGDGTLEIRDSKISNNYVGDQSGGEYGGGVYVGETPGTDPVEVLITGSTFKGNFAVHGRRRRVLRGRRQRRRDPQHDRHAATSRGRTAAASCSRAGTARATRCWSTPPRSPTTRRRATAERSGCSRRPSRRPSPIRRSPATSPGTVARSTTTQGPRSRPRSGTQRSWGTRRAESGGGIRNATGGTADVLTISSSIVSGNSAGTGPDLGDDGDGTFTVGNSLIGHARRPDEPREPDPGRHEQDRRRPAAGPLADNGGPTETMAPALASPAIDAGVGNGLTSDQRALAADRDPADGPALGRAPTAPTSARSSWPRSRLRTQGRRRQGLRQEEAEAEGQEGRDQGQGRERPKP